MKDGYNTTELWHRDLAHIFNMGSRVSPRSMGTREIVGFTSKIDMNFPVITCPIRALGYKFMFAEAAWILSGDNRVETITAYSKDIANFSDPAGLAVEEWVKNFLTCGLLMGIGN